MLRLFVGTLLFSVLFKNGFGFGQSRINQGGMVDIEDVPYMARVRIKINATVGGACGGTILSDMLILTAGHCVTAESNMNKPNPPLHDPSNFSILVGTNDLNDEGSGDVIGVSKVHFKEFSQQNDIAILELSDRIMLDGMTKDIAHLPLMSDYSPENRTMACVVGWGKNQQKSKKLLKAKVYTISVEECTTGYDAGRNRSHQICTLGDNGAGPCTGDSGGPLVTEEDNIQIGLVSFVPSDCANPDKTISTFTAIAPNLEWIQSVMAMKTQDSTQNSMQNATDGSETSANTGKCNSAQDSTQNPLENAMDGSETSANTGKCNSAQDSTQNPLENAMDAETSANTGKCNSAQDSTQNPLENAMDGSETSANTGKCNSAQDSTQNPLENAMDAETSANTGKCNSAQDSTQNPLENAMDGSETSANAGKCNSAQDSTDGSETSANTGKCNAAQDSSQNSMLDKGGV